MADTVRHTLAHFFAGVSSHIFFRTSAFAQSMPLSPIRRLFLPQAKALLTLQTSTVRPVVLLQQLVLRSCTDLLIRLLTLGSIFRKLIPRFRNHASPSHSAKEPSSWIPTAKLPRRRTILKSPQPRSTHRVRRQRGFECGESLILRGN